MRVAGLLRRLRLLFHRDRAMRDLEEEMRLHRDLRAAAPTPGHFGSALRHAEASRDAWGFEALDAVRQDVRYAVRRLRQRPGFALSVIAVLALGIGATTAMFSAVDAAMLRPLPFAHPEQLVTLPNVNVPFDPGPGQRFPSPSYHQLDINDVSAMRTLFVRAAAWASGGLNLSDPEHPRRLSVGVVTADFFNVLGVNATRGRTFLPEDGRPGANRVVVLSNELWREQFGARPMLHRMILLNDKPYEVIGIMPPGLSFPKQSDAWIPMAVPNTFDTFEAFHGFLSAEVIARLAPGVHAGIASKQLLAEWQLRANPDTTSSNGAVIAGLRQSGAVVPLQQWLTGDRRPALFVLLGATGLLLLIACANVTNLLLSQAISRRREMAVREVLGATRPRIVRQLLTESAILALGGALLGCTLAPASLGLLRTVMPAGLTGVAPVRLDLRVLAFAVGLGFITGVAFGLWPALRLTGVALVETVKSGGGHGATAGGTNGIRRGLVAAELALTVILLVGAGLMLRSFQDLMRLDRGMDVEHVGTLDMSFPRTTATRTRTSALLDALLARLRETPGVSAAGVVNMLPLGGSGGIMLSVTADGMPELKDDERSGSLMLSASEDYFGAMGIKLLAGRSIQRTDDSLTPAVAVINATMAKLYWPGVNAIGRTFHEGTQILTVVGIVGDVRELRLDDVALPEMYESIYAQPVRELTLVARGTLASPSLLAAMRAAVHGADPRQAVFHVRMMDDVLNASVAPRRTNTLLISLFAALALLLASLGVYAVVAHGVAQRAREFGIRSALGATGHDLVFLISREMAWVTGTGLIAGLCGAWALAHVASSLLYGVGVHDPVTFVVVPVVLLLPALAATLIPSWRAARVDPAEVMRAD